MRGVLALGLVWYAFGFGGGFGDWLVLARLWYWLALVGVRM